MTNLWKQPVLLHPVLLHPVTAVKTFQDKTGHTWKLGCANTRFHLCFIMESPVSLRHVWTSDHGVSYRYKPVCQPVTVTEIIRKIHLWELWKTPGPVSAANVASGQTAVAPPTWPSSVLKSEVFVTSGCGVRTPPTICEALIQTSVSVTAVK